MWVKMVGKIVVWGFHAWRILAKTDIRSYEREGASTHVRSEGYLR